jgi:hypothetical protein
MRRSRNCFAPKAGEPSPPFSLTRVAGSGGASFLRLETSATAAALKMPCERKGEDRIERRRRLAQRASRGR